MLLDDLLRERAELGQEHGALLWHGDEPEWIGFQPFVVKSRLGALAPLTVKSTRDGESLSRFSAAKRSHWLWQLGSFFRPFLEEATTDSRTVQVFEFRWLLNPCDNLRKMFLQVNAQVPKNFALVLRISEPSLGFLQNADKTSFMLRVV